VEPISITKQKTIKSSEKLHCITQLVIFNTMKRSRNESTAARHNLDRETRLPLYLGLLVHNKTRKRNLVDTLFQKGLSVSYDRVLQLSTDMANDVLDTFEDEGVVCPTILRSNLFTTGNLDNIDHNPTSTSSQSAFHGTAISLTQHVTDDCKGVISRDTPRPTTIKPLMETYSIVPPASFPDEHPSPSKTVGSAILQSSTTESDKMQVT
jgi:hypothetical protein